MELEQKEKEFIIKFPEDINQVFPYLGRLFLANEINNSITFAQFVITEFCLNAFKAIQKRIYYKESQLDINNPADYARGIDKFKHTIKNDDIDIKKILERHPDYTVKVRLIQEKDGVLISVINNSGMLKAEADTVNDVIKHGAKEDILHDPAYQPPSESEGGGIGLKMIMMMAKNMGFSPNVLTFEYSDSETRFNVKIPSGIKEEDRDVLSIISSLISRKMKSVPILEQSLETLIESDYSSNLLFKDPGFLINYLLSKMDNPVSAASLFKGDVAKEFFSHHIEFTAISDNSELGKVYTEAVEISAIILVLQKMIHLEKAELCRVAGLLCRLGKIISLSIDDKLAEEIRDLTNRSNPLSEDVPKELTIGINDSMLGLTMAKFWGFPAEIIKSIQYHEKPWMDKTNDPVTATTHLALAINQLRKRENNLNFDENVLKKLKIQDTDIKKFYKTFIDYIDKKGNH